MNLPSEHELEIAVANAWPTHSWCDSHVVLGVSGGADSVAMLRAVVGLKARAGGSGRLFVAHLHHGMRGPAADEDQAWLVGVCRRLDVPLELGQAAVAALAAADGDGWEAAARAARYAFLRQSAERIGARFVAVAHTADDQAETVLHRLLRGTGLAGLAGIPRVRALSPSVSLVRPLLEVRRPDVLQYLAALGQDFRQDASNADSRWTRNRLRNELLPLLRAGYNPEVDQSLRRLARQAGQAQQLVTELAAKLAEGCLTTDSVAESSITRIHCRVLAGQMPLVVSEVCKVAWKQVGWPLQAMGFHEWRLMVEMVKGEPCATAVNFPGNVRAWREGEELVLERCQKK
jgi:tRNA(Ile)-lysidine synthase